MPTLEEMPPLSRPFQILLVVFVLFAGAYGAWFLVLREPSSSTTSASTAQSTSTAVARAPRVNAPKTPESGKVYHGAAPGLEGLTRDVAKAHGAVTQAQHSGEHELNRAGAASAAAGASPSSTNGVGTQPQASSTHHPASSSASSTASVAKPALHSASKPTTSAAQASKPKSTAAPATAGSGQVPAKQALVEGALKQGKIAVILFWNPKGADDVADRFELQVLEAVHHLIPALARRVPALRKELKQSGLELEKKFAAFEASASQVTSFGTITRGVQVYGTPTLLVVNPKGQVTTITGLTDGFAIEQAIDEARHS
jgi:hypothetical protein